MTFEPVLPAAVLIIAAAVLIVVRLLTLPRSLGSAGRGHLRWSGLTVAVLLILLAAARPGLTGDGGSASAASATDGSAPVNVFFVVDRSVTSRVEDFGNRKPRIAGIRDDMTAVIDQYPRARFAVISFASKPATDWPLSEDVWSLKPWIDGLSPYAEVAGSAMNQVDAAAADNLLRYTLNQAQYQFPKSENLVFYFGQGAGGSRAPQGTFELGSASVSGGAVLGYGTTIGGPIPDARVGGDVSFLADPQTGVPLSSAINEPALQAIAGQLGLPYIHRETAQGIADVLPVIDPDGSGDGALLASQTQRTELYWVFTLLAAVLVLSEIYLVLREFRRNRTARRDVAL